VAALVVKEKDSAWSRSPVVSFVAEAVLHIAAAVVTKAKAKAKAMNLVTEFALAVLVTVDPVVVLVLLLVLVAFAYLLKEGQHDYLCTDTDVWECPFPIGKLHASQQQESKRTSKQQAEGNITCKILHKVHRLKKPYNITVSVSVI
jgi:hypothetical protein